jgi:SpoOM protein
MFGQIKRILGIEGVKIDVEVHQPVKLHSGILNGKVRLITIMDSEVSNINIRLIEKYHRGRKKDKLIDEYTVGTMDLNEGFSLKKDEIIEIPFELPFKYYQSEMDKMQDKNFLAAGIVKMAKFIKGVKSEYRIEAEATVKGTKLNPVSKKDILVQS